MLVICFAPAFERSLKKLPLSVKENVKTAVSQVIDLYESDVRTGGLGIKRIRGTIWEARVGLKIRILYELAENRLTFILAGSHDDLKNFLKR